MTISPSLWFDVVDSLELGKAVSQTSEVLETSEV